MRRKSDYFLSPNGLTSKSMKRLNSMRQSQTEINSILSRSVLRVSRLDSDFEATFHRTEAHSNNQVKEQSNNWNIITLPAFIPDYDPQEKSHACTVCKRTFFHSHSLEAHMVLHSKRDLPEIIPIDSEQKKNRNSNRLFRCKICSKEFKKKWKLRFHVARKHICTGGTKVLLVI